MQQARASQLAQRFGVLRVLRAEILESTERLREDRLAFARTAESRSASARESPAKTPAGARRSLAGAARDPRRPPPPVQCRPDAGSVETASGHAARASRTDPRARWGDLRDRPSSTSRWPGPSRPRLRDSAVAAPAIGRHSARHWPCASAARRRANDASHRHRGTAVPLRRAVPGDSA